MTTRFRTLLLGGGLALALVFGFFLLRSRENTPGPLPKKVETAPPRASPEARTTVSSKEVEPCHLVPLAAQPVPIEVTSASPQALTGGVVKDGVYDVVSYLVHAPAVPKGLPSNFRQTLAFEENGARSKTVRVGVRGEEETTTWSSKILGNEIELSGVCPPEIAGASERIVFETRGETLVTRFEQLGVPVTVSYRRR
jgi:hypothetical protein